MSAVDSILLRTFGRPQGLLGRIGGAVMARTNRKYAVWSVELLDVQPGEHVLEVGFGPGVGVEELTGRTRAGHIAGVDPSPEMLDQALRRNQRAIAQGRVELRLGAAESLPFADQSFDKALTINSMQMWPDARSGLCEVARVLRANATFALCFTVHSRQGREGMPELLTSAGFLAPQVVDGDKAFCLMATRAGRN